MLRRAYREDNPTPTATKILLAGTFVAVFAFAAMKMREN